MSNLQRYALTCNALEHGITVEVDLEILTPALALQIVDSFDNKRSARAGQEVERALELLGVVMFYALSEGMSESGVQRRLDEAECVPTPHGIRVIEVDEFEIDEVHVLMLRPATDKSAGVPCHG